MSSSFPQCRVSTTKSETQLRADDKFLIGPLTVSSWTLSFHTIQTRREVLVDECNRLVAFGALLAH